MFFSAAGHSGHSQSHIISETCAESTMSASNFGGSPDSAPVVSSPGKSLRFEQC
jgi:hypothetical protein